MADQNEIGRIGGSRALTPSKVVHPALHPLGHPPPADLWRQVLTEHNSMHVFKLRRILTRRKNRDPILRQSPPDT